MKKLLSFFSIVLIVQFITISCQDDSPTQLGKIITATYGPNTKSFIVEYSNGSSETVEAVVDNSSNPPSASATLKNGTTISVSDANEGGEISFRDKGAYESSTYNKTSNSFTITYRSGFTETLKANIVKDLDVSTAILQLSDKSYLIFEISEQSTEVKRINSKGKLVSASYNIEQKNNYFTLRYDSGYKEVVIANIDSSTTPASANATLINGISFLANDANISGEATINSGISSAYKYVNDWIYENMSIYYLWNYKLGENLNYSLTPDDFFDSILYKYSATNPDGDRFSWIQEDYTELLKSLSGVTSDEIGFDYIFVWANEAKTHYYALVTYTKLGTDASAKGIKRGRFVTKINGQNITAQNYKTLFGGTGTKTLSMADWKLNTTDQKYYLTNSSDVTITMQKDFAENPVYMDSVYTVGNKKIGYLTYNFFARDKDDESNDYDKLLMSKLNGIKAKGATEMVLDLRYNSGGAVSSAIALASALVKNRSTSNILVTSQYNNLVHNELQKEYGKDYNKEYFIDKITNGTTVVANIPSLNLNRLYVLTGNYTASASEFIINGLKPYMDVILIGETTYGKNVGSITLYEKEDPKNKWGMQPIVVKYLNSKGESDFTTGFKPNYEIDEFDDLFLYQFGDTKDPLLGKAISLITGTTLSTRAAKPITETRSIKADENIITKKSYKFEMYDDVHGDAIRNLMKK